MYERSSSLVLRWLKVPPAPQPPHGDPASLRVFRAGKNLFNLRLAGWAVAQLLALAGIIFWAAMFFQVEQSIKVRRQAGEIPVQPTSVKDFEEYVNKIGAEEKPTTAAVETASSSTAAPAVAAAAPGAKQDQAKTPDGPKKKRPRVRINGWAGFKAMLVQVGMLLPPWSFPLLWALKIFGFVLYLIQIPITYTVRRLDYELRWYMVTDRSLRIRHGVWKVSESTMSFANIQQVVVSQGPLQRVLGLADVKVQSAGGGSGGEDHHRGDGEDMHLGLFHSVTNAPEIRDLILDRLRHFRESGLGDPDEKPQPLAPTSMVAPSAGDTLAAARELLAEAKALRTALS